MGALFKRIKVESDTEIKDFLEAKYYEYASAKFVTSDPIQIPHNFTRKEDIEISAFLTATLAWGQRSQIIKSSNQLINQMGESPYEFIVDASNNDIGKFSGFYYRTFNGVDCMTFLKSLKRVYVENADLEQIFADGFKIDGSIKGALSYFRKIFIGNNFPSRSQKHVSNVMAGSAGKRLNMFLRWMVRPSAERVDFGIWDSIPTSALMLPLDVHSGRVARKLGLITRKQTDWRAVEEVTENLRKFDPNDPVKYDFALFGLGVFEKF